MKKVLVLITVLLLIPLIAAAQDFCQGNFDYDENVDGTDLAIFKSNYGRNIYNEPCPPDGPAPVPKTGQTTSYATGDDGDLEKGVAWPIPRFTDNGDGTVLDNLTGLIWLKNANCFGQRMWFNALSDSNGLQDGLCGLTDGSGPGDWRLPNRFQMESLLELENFVPALPFGHPFISVQLIYWSSTSDANFPTRAWGVELGHGSVYPYDKPSLSYVWPVRGGH